MTQYILDPLPDAAAIRAAFKADPEYKTLTGRNADRVMQNIVERCRYNGWKIPEAIGGLEHWGTLFVKWHWHCTDRLKLVGPNALPRQWEGKPKAIVEKAHPLLQPPKKRKPSRNYWFDHAPFRMMFGNQTCGMSWLKDEFAASRTFILLNGDSPRIGIVPRNSRFCPYTLPDAQPDEASYLLYEESQGEAPRLRAVPKERVDIPTRKGLVFLFELDGKGLRGISNLNALYLRALFSPENLASRDIHLDGNAEFHVRKGTDIPRDDEPEHFRQRFTEDRFFVTLRLTFNAQMASTGAKATSFGNLASYIAANPETRFIDVSGESFPLQGGKGASDVKRKGFRFPTGFRFSVKGAVAGEIVVLGGGLALWYFVSSGGCGTKRPTSKGDKSALIAEVERDGRVYLNYTPHKTAHSSGRMVRWPVHADLWRRIDALCFASRTPGCPALLPDEAAFGELNRQMRELGFAGPKGAYELRKICIDHVYQRFGAEMTVSISGDDIRTIIRYYADPAQPNVGDVRIADLL